MKTKRKRPESRRAEVMSKTPSIKVVDKTFTAFNAAPETGGSGAGETGQMFTPTPDELAQINQFTKKPLTAEEVAAFPTMSCNDLLDRDLDRFTTDAVKKFSKLPGTRSFVGKSFMVSHDTTKLPVGRIFDVGTKKMETDQGDATFLTNKVYIPRLESNGDFIKNMEAGVYWAVSVGVMMGTSLCNIGDPHPYDFRWWCSEGHEKGLYYDPKSTDTDEWGWPEPVEQGTKGAVLCTRELDDPQDGYELSMVYLGAQYYAELAAKDPDFAGVVKAASSRTLPVIGLRRSEAEKLPFQHINPKAAEARKLYVVSEDGDGRMSWKQPNGLVYSYDPDDDEVLCLGADDGPNIASADLTKLQDRFSTVRAKFASMQPALAAFTKGEGEDDVDATELADELADLLGTMRSQLEAQDYEGLATTLDDAESKLSTLSDALGVEAEVDDPEPEPEPDPKGAGQAMSKKRVRDAARAAKVPSSIIERLEDADDATALDVLMTAVGAHFSDVDKTVTEMRPLAEAGQKHLDELKAAVVGAYVKAFQTGETKGVDTSMCEKLIERCGNDPELLDDLRKQYIRMAEEKLPTSVRRSSFPTDPHQPSQPKLPGAANKGEGEGETDQGGNLATRRRMSPVSRIHGA